MLDQLHVVCPHCGKTNRVPGASSGAGRCGSCKGALFTGHPVEADGQMFDKQTGRSDIPVLVDVWAPWCGPCRAMAPAYEQAAARLEPQVRVIKLNSDAHPDVSARLGIRGIPTLLLFRGGREIARSSGARGADQIISWTRESLKSA